MPPPNHLATTTHTFPGPVTRAQVRHPRLPLVSSFSSWSCPTCPVAIARAHPPRHEGDNERSPVAPQRSEHRVHLLERRHVAEEETRNVLFFGEGGPATMDRSTDCPSTPTPGWSASVASAPAVPAAVAGAASLVVVVASDASSLDRGWIPLRIARLGILPRPVPGASSSASASSSSSRPGRREGGPRPSRRASSRSRVTKGKTHTSPSAATYLVHRRERRVHLC